MKISSNPPMAPQGAEQPRAITKEENEALRKVSKGFESVFVNQLMGAMRKTVVKGGMIPESNAERTYQAMLDQEYVEKVSESGQLGVAQLVYDHLLRKSQQR